MVLLPQCFSLYPCGHGTVFTLPSRRFRPQNFRHPTSGRVVRSPAETALPRRPDNLPSRALCLVVNKNQIAVGQLQTTMVKYNSLNRIQASDEEEMQEWDAFLHSLINITRNQSAMSQMYAFVSAIKQYMALILAAEMQGFGTDFHSDQTALHEIKDTHVKLQQLQCSLYLVLKKGGARLITSSLTSVPKEDVVFYHGHPDRAQRFKRDIQIFGSALKLLQMAGLKIGAKITGSCP